MLLCIVLGALKGVFTATHLDQMAPGANPQKLRLITKRH